MNKMSKISRNSWHYKLANFGDNDFKYFDGVNSCVYVKYLMKGFLVVLILSVLALLLVGLPFFSLGTSIFCETELNACVGGALAGLSKMGHTISIVLTTMLFMFLVVWGAYYIKDIYQGWRQKIAYNKYLADKDWPFPKSPPEPHPITVMYRNWKDKICSEFEIVE